jgi:hypothetical protein
MRHSSRTRNVALASLLGAAPALLLAGCERRAAGGREVEFWTYTGGGAGDTTGRFWRAVGGHDLFDMDENVPDLVGGLEEGRLPEGLRRELEAQGIWLSDEVSVTAEGVDGGEDDARWRIDDARHEWVYFVKRDGGSLVVSSGGFEEAYPGVTASIVTDITQSNYEQMLATRFIREMKASRDAESSTIDNDITIFTSANIKPRVTIESPSGIDDDLSVICTTGPVAAVTIQTAFLPAVDLAAAIDNQTPTNCKSSDVAGFGNMYTVAIFDEPIRC